MRRQIISIIYILIASTQIAFAGKVIDRSKFIDLSKFTQTGSESFNDIGYLHIVPQYEENPNPDKAVSIEFFFGEYDGSPESAQRLAHIKELIADDKKLDPNFKTDIIAVSNQTDTLKNSRELDSFLSDLNFQDKNVHFQQIPSFLDYNAKVKELKKNKRVPSSIMDGRKFWSFVRFSSSMAGAFAGLYFLEGMSASMAAAVTIWPGLVSGGITYYSNAYGAFLTNGKWATWLMESENYFANKIRKAFSLNPLNFKEALVRNKEFFNKKYPDLFEKNPTLFEEKLFEKSKKDEAIKKERFTKVLSRLHTAEEYFKWWVTEVIFTAVAIKLPQAVAGISNVTGLLSMTGEILLGSTMGTIAQGPGDIAIQLRKYQMIRELKDNIHSGKVQVDNKIALLDEIEKVLATKGEFKNYLIHDGSHSALVKIENWARSRATFLSFFAVTGVALEIAGVPLARPLLIATGAGGAIYYSVVQGWIKPKKWGKKITNYVERFKRGNVKFSLQFLPARYCGKSFVMKSL